MISPALLLLQGEELHSADLVNAYQSLLVLRTSNIRCVGGGGGGCASSGAIECRQEKS